MTYKAIARRVPAKAETFTMGATREIRQRNGVHTTLTQAICRDGMMTREVTIFANGARAEAVRDYVAEGATSTLIGKYSQRNVFVALGVQAES